MLRNKRIIILSHCILNQNSVVKPLARSKGAYNEVLKLILDNDIGILQLPCPELLFYGATRPPMTKRQYNTAEYKTLCNSLLLPVLAQIKEYLSNSYSVIGLIGIEESPTCGMGNNQGILMEEFLSLLKSEKIELPTLQIPTDYLEGKNNQSFLSLLEGFLHNS